MRASKGPRSAHLVAVHGEAGGLLEGYRSTASEDRPAREREKVEVSFTQANQN